jgi:hypothetical protein
MKIAVHLSSMHAEPLKLWLIQRLEVNAVAMPVDGVTMPGDSNALNTTTLVIVKTGGDESGRKCR